MLPDVRRFISVEMIRDGGSFAAKFESGDGNQYILFAQVHFADVGPPKKDEHGYHQERELVGYDEPVIINCNRTTLMSRIKKLGINPGLLF